MSPRTEKVPAAKNQDSKNWPKAQSHENGNRHWRGRSAVVKQGGQKAHVGCFFSPSNFTGKKKKKKNLWTPAAVSSQLRAQDQPRALAQSNPNYRRMVLRIGAAQAQHPTCTLRAIRLLTKPGLLRSYFPECCCEFLFSHWVFVFNKGKEHTFRNEHRLSWMIFLNFLLRNSPLPSKFAEGVGVQNLRNV